MQFNISRRRKYCEKETGKRGRKDWKERHKINPEVGEARDKGRK